MRRGMRGGYNLFYSLFRRGRGLRVVSFKAVRYDCRAAAGIPAAAGAAYCNLKFGGEFDRALTECVRRTFIENAELMRPEKTSLGFVVKVSERSAEVKVNNFKEKTVFDFSPFGRLSAAKRSAAFSEIADVLSSTFLRLYGRGIRFEEVYYSADNKKGGRVNFIIKNGEPDKRAYKNYLKRK